MPNGRLPAPPHDATGHTWHHSDTQLFDMIANGTAAMMPGYETDMPAYRDILSDADIWAVLSFIESTWPRDIRERQQRIKSSDSVRRQLARKPLPRHPRNTGAPELSCRDPTVIGAL